MPPFKPTDASFNARAPVAAPLEPALALIRHACRCVPPWSREYHLFDAPLLRRLFIRWRRQLAITSEEVRGMVKLLDVLVQAGHELRRIVGMALSS